MHPNDISEQRILISALNWGMGHVFRCIPLINQLTIQNNYIVIACDEEQKKIFSSYLPNIRTEKHDKYPFKFGSKGYFTYDVIKNIKTLIYRHIKESKEVDFLIKKYRINLIISDHRYAFHSPKTPSIFITHQINLPLKWYMNWFQKFHQKLMDKFDYIWIPDFQNSPLSGKLSNANKSDKIIYIGPLSRFSNQGNDQKNIDIVVIVSGPLPYSLLFFNEQYEKYKNESLSIKYVVPEQLKELLPKDEKDILFSSDCKKCDLAIQQARKIVSRSGYTTIMDLHFLQIPADLSATPGQTEQEYLLSKRQ